MIGGRWFSHDLGGYSVTTASRMESQGGVDAVQTSGATLDRLDSGFEVTSRGFVDMNGNRGLEAFLVAGEAPGDSVSATPRQRRAARAT